MSETNAGRNEDYMHIKDIEMKIEIKHIDGSVIFEHDCERNTLEHTIETAIKRGKGLNGADLSYADLSYANFSRGWFTGARFVGANCTGTNFAGAQMDNVNAGLADFTGANLFRAYMVKASFYGTNLTCANLTQANTTKADFFSAKIGVNGRRNGHSEYQPD